MTVEFIGGDLDGYCTLMDDGRALREVTVDGAVYGCIDTCVTKDDVYLLYAYIEDVGATQD
jgi:hypothetical protein